MAADSGGHIIQHRSLTNKQLEAVALLADGENIRQTSIALKVDRGTIYDWLAKPEFAAELTKRTAAKRAEIERGLMQCGESALASVRKGTEGEEITPTQLKASQYALDRILGAATQRTEVAVVDDRSWLENCPSSLEAPAMGNDEGEEP